MPSTQPKAHCTLSAGSSNPSPARHALFNVSDQVEYLNDTHRAFEALEQLVTPIGAHDCQRLELERADLGCLLRVLNRGMRQQIDATMQIVTAAREAS